LWAIWTSPLNLARSVLHPWPFVIPQQHPSPNRNLSSIARNRFSLLHSSRARTRARLSKNTRMQAQSAACRAFRHGATTAVQLISQATEASQALAHGPVHRAHRPPRERSTTCCLRSTRNRWSYQYLLSRTMMRTSLRYRRRCLKAPSRALKPFWEERGASCLHAAQRRIRSQWRHLQSPHLRPQPKPENPLSASAPSSSRVHLSHPQRHPPSPGAWPVPHHHHAAFLRLQSLPPRCIGTRTLRFATILLSASERYARLTELVV
jgi:hypothetical protein